MDCTRGGYTTLELNNAVDSILEAMNLVFEATKKEYADKARVLNTKEEDILDAKGYTRVFRIVNEESILNINKPNL